MEGIVIILLLLFGGLLIALLPIIFLIKVPNELEAIKKELRRIADAQENRS